MKKIAITLIISILGSLSTQASVILLPMDTKQKEHLKAYGITFWVLNKGIEAHWLLNYR
ncbi:MAG: asparagine synthetase B, partial [Saprospiraceae bacterium]|nr:asparagine synthetase B [Saprospiraceae bacterium]